MDDPDLGVWSYAYDKVGNLVRQTDGRGVVVNFNYDELNRLKKVDYPTDADVSYSYDSPTKGTLSAVSGGFGSVSYEYNRRLQPVRESWSADSRSWVKRYAYDSLDRLYWSVYPDGGVNHVYFNDMGLLRQVPGVVGEFSYDAFGRVLGKTYASGLQTNLEFYPDDFRLKSIKTSGKQDLSYAYDDVGNVLSISSNAVEVYSQNFAYDGLDRLTSAAESPAGFTLSYKYDAVGNLLEVNSSGTVSTYTYGTGNSPGPHAVVQIQGGGQTVDCSGSLPPAVGNWIVNSPTLCRLSAIILSLGSKLSVTGGQSVTLQDSTLNLDGDVVLDGTLVLDGPSAGIDFGGNSASGVGTSGASPAGTQTLTYDNSGSLTSGFGQTYEYDDANRLKTVRKAGALVESYIYDHNGQRFKKVSGDETMYYIGKDYQTTVNASGTYNTIYYYANGELVGRKDASGTYYYHNDHLGGTHLVTDASGGEVERTRYQPYGGIIEGGESRNLYTGQEWDKSTGQYYYGARYYNPTLQRFTQGDTVIPDYYNPQTLNRYSYVNNNPLRYTDSTGNCAWDACAVEGSTAGIFAVSAVAVGLAYGAVDYITTEPSQRSIPRSMIRSLSATAGLLAAGEVGVITLVNTGGNKEAATIAAVGTYTGVKSTLESMFTSKNPLKPENFKESLSENLEDAYLQSQVFGPPGIVPPADGVIATVVEQSSQEVVWDVSSKLPVYETLISLKPKEDNKKCQSETS